MKKRVVSVLLASCLLTGLLAGCSGGNEGNSEDSGQTSDTAGKKELNVWYYWDNDQGEILQEYVDKFNEQSEIVSIKASYVPYAEYTQKVLTAAAGGSGPDVLIYGNNETSVLAESGVLGTMTDLVEEGGLKERILPEVMKSHEYNGEYYGLPIYGNCLALFYNKDMVSEPPKTWDDLLATAEEVTTSDTYALAFAAAESEEGTFQFLPWLWSAGADLDSLDSEEGIAALSLYKELVDEGYASKEVVGWLQQDAMLQFCNGRAAMMVNGPWQMPSIQENAPDLDYGVSILPARKEGEAASILGGESFGVAVNADKEAAKEFFDWIYGEENYSDFVKELGQLPAEEEMLMDSYYQDDPLKKAFADNLMVAKPRAYGPDYNEMSKAIQTAITASLSGMKSPEEAMKEAADVAGPLLEKQQ